MGKTAMRLLHHQYGTNPHDCYCFACGGKHKEVRHLYADNEIEQCPECGMVYIGLLRQSKCKCGTAKPTSALYAQRVWNRRELAPADEVPSTTLCTACAEFEYALTNAYRAGGVLVVCQRCDANHIMPANHAIAVNARTKLNKPAPAAVCAKVSACFNCMTREEADKAALNNVNAREADGREAQEHTATQRVPEEVLPGTGTTTP